MDLLDLLLRTHSSFLSANCNDFVPYESLQKFLFLASYQKSLLWLMQPLPPCGGSQEGDRQWVPCIWWDDVVHMHLVSPNEQGALLWLKFVPVYSVSLCAVCALWSISICGWVLRKGIMAQWVGNFWPDGGLGCGDRHMATVIKDCGPKAIVNAIQDLFLDCNLTPIFNFHNTG